MRSIQLPKDFKQPSQLEFCEKIIEQLDRIEALQAALHEADIACVKLCMRHGFATGHGDTVASMIEEIDAQISTRSALEKDTKQ